AVGEADADANAIAAAIRAANTGVEVEAINVVTTEFDRVSGTQAGETYTLTINDVEVINRDGGDEVFSLGADDIARAINEETKLAAMGITADVDDDGNLVITAADGRNISIVEGGTPAS